MFEDFAALLAVLNKHDVKYMVVGGCAVSFHAQNPSRITPDMDVLVRSDADNEKAIQGAMAELGIKRRKWRPMYFTELGKFYRLERPVKADVRPIDEVTFDAMWKR